MISAAPNQVTIIRRPVDDLVRCSASSPNTADTITESIMTILRPHTSSPSLHVIARVITSLIAGKFGDDDLCQILNAQLDTLAISPQAKQGIVPALVGIAKLTELQSRA
jgi:hypothetical protein